MFLHGIDFWAFIYKLIQKCKLTSNLSFFREFKPRNGISLIFKMVELSAHFQQMSLNRFFFKNCIIASRLYKYLKIVRYISYITRSSNSKHEILSKSSKSDALLDLSITTCLGIIHNDNIQIQYSPIRDDFIIHNHNCDFNTNHFENITEFSKYRKYIIP